MSQTRMSRERGAALKKGAPALSGAIRRMSMSSHTAALPAAASDRAAGQIIPLPDDAQNRGGHRSMTGRADAAQLAPQARRS